MRADHEFERERGGRRERPRRTGGKVDREDRRDMKAFLKTRTGVEAYVEPPTLHQQLSVVLVAADGEWLRFTLPDDRYLRKLSAKHRMPIYEVARIGYPRRMKEYRRGQD
jgi:hypothetical protein